MKIKLNLFSREPRYVCAKDGAEQMDNKVKSNVKL